MLCNHFCNAPLSCPTCTRRFWKWAEARTNAPPRKAKGGPSFYDHVNVVSEPVKVVVRL